jgi:hypothetical protein
MSVGILPSEEQAVNVMQARSTYSFFGQIVLRILQPVCFALWDCHVVDVSSSQTCQKRP